MHSDTQIDPEPPYPQGWGTPPSGGPVPNCPPAPDNANRKNKKIHPLERWKQRYGGELEFEQLMAMADLIRRNKVHGRRSLGEGTEEVLLRIFGRQVRCVWHIERERIMTFLAPLERYERRSRAVKSRRKKPREKRWKR